MPNTPQTLLRDRSTAVCSDRTISPTGVRSRQSAQSWQELTAGDMTLTGLARKAREIYGIRARRSRYFPEAALGEAAWDILLSLFSDTIEGKFTSTKSVAISGNVPVTTCLSLLDRLEEDGLIVRRRDLSDRRVTRVLLSPSGLLAMRDYLLEEGITKA